MMRAQWRGRRFLQYVAAGLLTLLIPGIAWATFSIIFRGVAIIVSTGSLSLNAPNGVAADTLGNIYIADTGDNQIVEVTRAGIASVVPITGLSPILNGPSAIAVDGSANLFIADSGNNRIVEVNGGVGSVIGTGGLTLNDPLGIAVDGSGNLFVADSGNNRIVKIPAGGSAAVLSLTGLGTPLNLPIGIAVDLSGRLIIGDFNNSRVVLVAPGGAATVLSITGLSSPLSQPVGIALDGKGNIYIADLSNQDTVVVDPTGAGTLLNTGSLLVGQPRGVGASIFGAIYIADWSYNQIVEVMPSEVGFGGVQVGASSGTTMALPFAVGVATVGSVQAFTTGTAALDFTVVGGTTCTNGTTSTNCTVNVQFLPTAPGLRMGALVISDQSGIPLITIPLFGTGDAPVAALAPNTASVISSGGVITQYPFQLALDGAGNMYVGNYVQAGSNPKVVKIPAGGGTATVVNTSPVTLGTSVTGIAIDGAGNLFIADYYLNRIVVVTPRGGASVLSISGLSPALGEPTELAFDGAGNLYIADYSPNARIVEVSSLTITETTSSGAGRIINTGSYTFTSSSVTGVAVAPNGTVYIAARTSNSSHVVQVTAAGVASLVTPTGLTFSDPQGAFVDAMGNLYVADSGNNRIVRITTAGVASVVSVPGLTSPSTLASGFGMTADPYGNIYIPDWTNSRIVFVNVSGAALTFASTKQGLTSTDSPKTATVTNLGDQPLVFSANPTYTADFPNNSGDTNPCTSSTSLSAGTACDVSVNFTPQSVASLSAGIVVTDDNLNVASSTQIDSVSGTGLTAGDTTATAVAFSVSPANIGQPLTITATVTDTAAGHTATVPTGPVTFSDTVGSTATPLNGGSAVNLTAGNAVLSAVMLSGAGSHTITASYAGVSSSFLASINTGSLTLNKDIATIAGPLTQPVSIAFGQAGAVPVTVTGPYSVVAPPSGSVSYSILNSSNTSVASATLSLTAGSTSSTATVPAASSLAPGTYTVNVTYNGDGNYAVSAAPTTIQILISKVTPSIALTSSVNPVLVTNPVTFTATIASSSGTPTGTASFYDGTTLLGTGTLVQGVAMYTTASLAVGSHSVTAVYGGDSTFATQTSTAVSEKVDDFSLSVTTTSSSSATVLPGGIATYVLAIGPTTGTTFPAPVTLSVSGLPPGATSIITPQILPAGSSLTNVTLSIQLPNVTASLPHSNLMAFTLSPIAFGMLLLPFCGKKRRAAGKGGRRASLLLFVFAMTLLTGLAGCASQKSGYFGQSQQTYTLTFTGTSGALAHSTTLTLTVQ